MKLPFGRPKAEQVETERTRAPKRRGGKVPKARPADPISQEAGELRLDGADAFLGQPGVAATHERLASSAPVHQLAATVIDSHVAKGGRGLAVCGATATAGAIGVASSLATAISMDGIAVLLVDARLTQPATSPGNEERSGLADMLLDEDARLEDLVLKDVLPGLDLLTPGSALSADMLEGERFSLFLRQMLRLYDFTIVCAPPANRSSGALAIARNLGHAVIVARASRTYYEDLAQMSGSLRTDGVNIVGAILIQR